MKRWSIAYIDMSISSGIQTFEEVTQFLNLEWGQILTQLRIIHGFICELAYLTDPGGLSKACTHIWNNYKIEQNLFNYSLVSVWCDPRIELILIYMVIFQLVAYS